MVESNNNSCDSVVARFDATVEYDNRQDPVAAAIGYRIQPVDKKGIYEKNGFSLDEEHDNIEAEFRAAFEACKAAQKYVNESSTTLHLQGDCKSVLKSIDKKTDIQSDGQKNSYYRREIQKIGYMIFDDFNIKKIDRRNNRPSDQMAAENCEIKWPSIRRLANNS